MLGCASLLIFRQNTRLLTSAFDEGGNNSERFNDLARPVFFFLFLIFPPQRNDRWKKTVLCPSVSHVTIESHRGEENFFKKMQQISDMPPSATLKRAPVFYFLFCVSDRNGNRVSSFSLLLVVITVVGKGEGGKTI